MTMRSVASAPVGAPFAMSTLGTGANRPGCSTGPATACGWDQLAPPLVERDMNSNGALPPETDVPTPNTYAVPRLSVRTVQPSSGLRCPLLAAGVIWCWVQVSPPSRETATFSGAGAALPFSWPRKDAQHT